MALPKTNATPREQYLQDIVSGTPAAELMRWQRPAKDDYEIIGEFIEQYSFIDFNLRRFIEVLDAVDVLPKIWKGEKGEKLPIAEVDIVIQAAPGWDKNNLIALDRIVRYRGMRNLLAHFVIRRFPEDDAFLFVAKSARDYKQQFGREPRRGEGMTAVMDAQQVRNGLRIVRGLAAWIEQATLEVEDQYFAHAKRAAK
jgi:hypothetical protein